MKLERRYELQKKRLDRALQEIEKLKSELDEYKKIEGNLKAQSLEMEKTKKEFEDLIDVLNSMRCEYEILIHQLKILNKQ